MSPQTAAKTVSSQSYDEVPYISNAYPMTHPSHLYAVAKLFGLTPPDFKTARVLELGCASGGNLLPLAIQYPKAHFVGLDFSKEQITTADKQKQALNLSNIEFIQQDILTYKPADKSEKFDYIISHGVLSWVPEAVQERVFAISNEFLSPNGIALISYNTLPGWNAVRGLRDMMLYHTNRFTKPAEKIQQSRLLLDFLAENIQQGQAGYRALIDDERQLIKDKNDAYVYHEHLESVNAQFYFHEFARLAKEHGLDYIGDTNVATMYVGNMPPKALEALQAVQDVINQEQYMDYITNRRFRSSLLCKSGQKINRALKNEQIMDYFLTANPQLEASGSDPKKEIVYKANTGTLTMNNEIVNTLLLELLASGQKPLASAELVARAQKKLGLKDAASVQDTLVHFGLQLFLRGYINIHADSPHYVTEISEKPVVFPLARYQAKIPNNFQVTNTLSLIVNSDSVVNLIMQNMDGSRSLEEMTDILVENIKKGFLKMEKGNAPVKDEAEIRQNASQILEEVLHKLAQHGLLVA